MDQFIRFREELDRQYENVDLSPRPASQSRTVISMVMEIEHANNAGYVHGGTIMRLVDTAAGIAAARHARRRVVTAAMDDMSFLSPVYIGDLVTVQAMVNDAHRSSMEVGVRVDVETVPTGLWRLVASAHLVFVGLDASGKPAQVPPVVAETDEERRRQAQARVRREQRLVRKRALAAAGAERGTIGAMSDTGGAAESMSEPPDGEEGPPPDESTLLGAQGVEAEVLAEAARAEAELADPTAPVPDDEGAQV